MRYRPSIPRPIDGEVLDQPQAIGEAVKELQAAGDGDILVFCSGEREIRDAAEALTELELRNTEIVPLYARLSAAEQQRVFQPHRGRRVVLATNVAETSLTVPGIRYVVDAGFARISRFNRRTKVQRLPSRRSRRRRPTNAGRCGRLGPGICIRLYSEEDFDARPAFTEPEIQRTNLASVILQMAAIGLGDIEGFPFVDPPDARSIRDGIALLEELDAVRPGRQRSRKWLTPTGRKLARIPLDPRLARMILEADRNGALHEVMIITAGLSIQDPRERPRGPQQQAALELHNRFKDPSGDFVSYLHLWEYLSRERRERSSNQFRKMCRAEHLHYMRVREWSDVLSQLRRVARDLGLHVNHTAADTDQIHRSLLAGLLSQVAMKDPTGPEFRGARNAKLMIAPGSVFSRNSPKWIMAGELVETNRLWARVVARIEPEWLESVGDHLVKRTYADPWWDAERGSAVSTETVSLYGLPLVANRRVNWGRIDPVDARARLLLHALVRNEWDADHDFIEHNNDQIAEVIDLENRHRRHDLLVDEAARLAFFDTRVPADITTRRQFDKWWKRTRREQPTLLDYTQRDLIRPEAADLDDSGFPMVWHHGDIELNLSYAFDTGSAE
ncbi:MAG: ATP-dependent RNA helicase HrpA, partial [Acidimicrobiales bacterium]